MTLLFKFDFQTTNITEKASHLFDYLGCDFNSSSSWSLTIALRNEKVSHFVYLGLDLSCSSLTWNLIILALVRSAILFDYLSRYLTFSSLNCPKSNNSIENTNHFLFWSHSSNPSWSQIISLIRSAILCVYLGQEISFSSLTWTLKKRSANLLDYLGVDLSLSLAFNQTPPLTLLVGRSHFGWLRRVSTSVNFVWQSNNSMHFVRRFDWLSSFSILAFNLILLDSITNKISLSKLRY